LPAANKQSDWDLPEDLAKFFGSIEEADNYLAHSIRKIEKFFFEDKLKRKHAYPIQIQEIARDNYTVEFCERGCVIRIFIDGIKPQVIRLRLAHELGHIVYDYYDKNSHKRNSSRDRTSLKEEFFCWVFAYNLIKTKSDEYKNVNGFSNFRYNDSELAKSILVFAEKADNADIYEGKKLKTLLEQYFKSKGVSYKN
jgi:hypothetical protein